VPVTRAPEVPDDLWRATSRPRTKRVASSLLRTVPRLDRERPPVVPLDSSLPVLLLKIGRYSLSHGSLGALRSLGRAGVPVTLVTESLLAPACLSRYATRRIRWPTTGTEPTRLLVDGLAALGRRQDARSLVIATDDEAAVLVAEHSPELGDLFVLPPVAPRLPGMLASKRELFELCGVHGVPTPKTAFPHAASDVVGIARDLEFPVVVKSVEPWVRLQHPVVRATTVVTSPEDLLALARGREAFPALVQEHIPDSASQDWIVAAYFDRRSEPAALFTARKLRSWPPRAGVTTYAQVRSNDVLAETAAAFCRGIAYRGIIDMDWRFDERDGQYKLLDANPRLGAQFRLFETDVGIDVVRAMHLDLSGRAVPCGQQIEGETIIVEHLDVPARLRYRAIPTREARAEPAGRPRLTWAAADDPLPAAAALAFALVECVRALRRRALRLVRGALARGWLARRPGPAQVCPS